MHARTHTGNNVSGTKQTKKNKIKLNSWLLQLLSKGITLFSFIYSCESSSFSLSFSHTHSLHNSIQFHSIHLFFLNEWMNRIKWNEMKWIKKQQKTNCFADFFFLFHFPNFSTIFRIYIERGRQFSHSFFHTHIHTHFIYISFVCLFVSILFKIHVNS